MSAAERLEELLKLKPHTAVAVHDPSNMFYLTEGYTGEGMVFLSLNRRVIAFLQYCLMLFFSSTPIWP